jgi:hypothetical protein
MSLPVLQPHLDTPHLAEALGIDRSPSPLVSVMATQLQALSEQIGQSAGVAPSTRAKWDDPEFWNVDAQDGERSQFFAIGNCINFRFWSLDRGQVVPAAGEIDGTWHRGAMYMWRCLRRAVSREDLVPMDALALRGFSDADFDRIFADDRGVNPLDTGRQERILNLRNLGEVLTERWDGAFFNLIGAANGSLVRFAQLSQEIRAFDDPLFKLTMVNAIVHSGSEIVRFDDDPLPAIDYHLVRQALRQGLLSPGSDLRRKLVGRVQLTDFEGYELRRAALSAYIALSEKTGLSGDRIDNLYWQNRVNCSDSPVCLDPATADRCPFIAACARQVEFDLPIEITRYY